MGQDWESLIKSQPSYELFIINTYERLSRRLFSQAACHNASIRIDSREVQILNEMLKSESSLPSLWEHAFQMVNDKWVSWAQLDSQTLNWDWHFQPLTPLSTLSGVWSNNALLMLANSGKNNPSLAEL